jgi:hypothetical protein
MSSDPPSQVNATAMHPARRYNYWLGGKDNFAADRASGDEIALAFPGIVTAALENRGFLRRAVGFLAEKEGVRQFLDIGTGLPTANNTHEVAQTYVPDARVVYVDNDPLVMVHARALLNADPPAVTTYIHADLRDPDQILGDAELTATLDLSQPVALLLVAILHFITDDAEAYAAVKHLMNAMAPGSFLVLSHATYDLFDARSDTLAELGKVDLGGFRPRTRAQVEGFFGGFDLISPGVEVISEWHPEPSIDPRPRADEVAVYGAIARKP